MRFAFDFFNTLDLHEDVRAIARAVFAKGHEVHIVSAISPGLPFDYAAELAKLDVPFTAVHRVDHIPALKVEVLQQLQADGFWDDLEANVHAALVAGFRVCHVGVNPAGELRRAAPLSLSLSLSLSLPPPLLITMPRIDALDAVVMLARWRQGEGFPEHANVLIDRLLTSLGPFTPAETETETEP